MHGLRITPKTVPLYLIVLNIHFSVHSLLALLNTLGISFTKQL